MEKLKEYLKKNKKKVIIASTIVLTLVCVFAVAAKIEADNRLEQERIELVRSQINDHKVKLSEEADEAKKLELIKELRSEFKKYKSEDDNEDLIKEYETLINDSVKVFTDKTDKVIKDNTLTEEEIKKAKQKDLEDKKKVLDQLSKDIEVQVIAIYTEDELKEKQKEIKDLSDSYANQVTKIKEAAAKKKKEEDKKIAENKGARDKDGVYHDYPEGSTPVTLPDGTQGYTDGTNYYDPAGNTVTRPATRPAADNSDGWNTGTGARWYEDEDNVRTYQTYENENGSYQIDDATGSHSGFTTDENGNVSFGIW